MEKEDDFNTTVLMTARLLGLQSEVYYLQMFDLQGEKAKKLDAFLEKIANLHRNNKGAKIARQYKEKPFVLSAKQAYCISKAAIKYKIEL